MRDGGDGNPAAASAGGVSYRYQIRAKKAMVRSGVEMDSSQVCILEHETVFISDTTIDAAPTTKEGAARLRILASGPRNGFGVSYQGFVSAKVCERCDWSRDFQGIKRGR